MEVNIHEAKTHLSKLIERAMNGEEVVIAKAGKPMVRLTRIEKPRVRLGTMKGLIRFKPGWDDPLTDAEIEELFLK